MRSPPLLNAVHLDLLPYREADRLQDRLVEARLADQVEDTLLLLEHSPVFTFGRRAGTRHLRVSPGQAERAGIDLCSTDRGGDITYHGPGQLVGYLIAKLGAPERNVPQLFRRVEAGICQALQELGVVACGGTPDPASGARARLDLSGVWVGHDKIAAIGLRLTSWVTKHGFALNIDPIVEHFQMITACGLSDRGVTSLAAQTAQEQDRAVVESVVARCLAQALGRRLCWQAASSLDTLGPTSL